MSYFAIGGNFSVNGCDTRLRAVSPHQECVSLCASMGLLSRLARMRPDRRSTSRLRKVARLSTSARDSARSIQTIGLPCVFSAWALCEGTVASWGNSRPLRTSSAGRFRVTTSPMRSRSWSRNSGAPSPLRTRGSTCPRSRREGRCRPGPRTTRRTSGLGWTRSGATHPPSRGPLRRRRARLTSSSAGRGDAGGAGPLALEGREPALREGRKREGGRLPDRSGGHNTGGHEDQVGIRQADVSRSDYQRNMRGQSSPTGSRRQVWAHRVGHGSRENS